jgi:hypothetical protein
MAALESRPIKFEMTFDTKFFYGDVDFLIEHKVMH